MDESKLNYGLVLLSKHLAMLLYKSTKLIICWACLISTLQDSTLYQTRHFIKPNRLNSVYLVVNQRLGALHIVKKVILNEQYLGRIICTLQVPAWCHIHHAIAGRYEELMIWSILHQTLNLLQSNLRTALVELNGFTCQDYTQKPTTAICDIMLLLAWNRLIKIFSFTTKVTIGWLISTQIKRNTEKHRMTAFKVWLKKWYCQHFIRVIWKRLWWDGRGAFGHKRESSYPLFVK